MKFVKIPKDFFKGFKLDVKVKDGILDVKKLEISYPNYFMDTKTLVRNLSLIMVDSFI